MSELANSSNSTPSNSQEAYPYFLIINGYLAILLGYVAAFIFLYFVIRKSHSVRPLRLILFVSVFVNLYTLNAVVFVPARVRLNDGVQMFVFRGLPQLFSPEVQWFFLFFPHTMTTLPSAALPVELWVRLHILKHRVPPSSRQFAWIIFLTALLVSLGATVIPFDYYFHINNQIDYTNLWFNVTPTPVILASDYKRNTISKIFAVYRSLLSVGSFILAILIATWSHYLMKLKAVKLSNKTKLLVTEYSRSVFVQLLIPIFTYLFPIFAMFMSIIGYQVPYHDMILSILFIWSPFVSSASYLFLLGCYRQLMFLAIRNMLNLIGINLPKEQTAIQVISKTT
ncbi:hypothetical protein M3Y94_01263900 [Aphelenchoides besseyi]|nr:hypothetical protein M3Y94_01263900 [Aphelenchoides besseyi]